MNKLTKFLFIAILGLGLAISSVSADAAKGQKLYLKFMKSSTGMNGAEFASERTMAEWKALCADNGKGFIDEYSERFPEMESFFKGRFDKFQSDICDFVINFANDSGNIPSC